MAAPFCLPSGTGDLGRYWAAKVQGPGAKFSQRAKRAPGKSLRALCPERSGGRGLARSGPPATIGSQKANQ